MGQDIKQQVSNVPWKEQQPYIQNLFSEAQRLYKEGGPRAYPGQLVAGWSPEEQTAFGMLSQYGLGGAQQVANTAQDAWRFALGDVLDPNTNRYLAAHAEGAVAPVWEKLHEQTLPQLGSGAVIVGGYGGDRSGIAQALSVDKSVEDILNTRAKIYSDAYLGGLDLYGKALGLSDDMMELGTAPSRYVAAPGEAKRAMDQAQIDADRYRWEFAQNQPWNNLANYGNAISGNWGGVSTGSVSGKSDTEWWQDALGAVSAAGQTLQTIGDIDWGSLGDIFGDIFS